MTDRTPVLVTMRHARAARLDGKPINCAPGIWAWLARHGIDAGELVRDGVSSDRLEHIDDAFVQRAIAIARQEAADA